MLDSEISCLLRIQEQWGVYAYMFDQFTESGKSLSQMLDEVEAFKVDPEKGIKE